MVIVGDENLAFRVRVHFRVFLLEFRADLQGFGLID
jgi:hypothetical protein